MTDPGRSGYAVSAGKDGDPTTTSTTAASVPQPLDDISAAISHLRAAIRLLETRPVGG